MNQEIFYRLKVSCKAQGMTYKDLARVLSLSEVSIKRIFSTKKCSLEQFHKLCDALHIHPSEVDRDVSGPERPLVVSKRLEEYFMKNFHVFLFYPPTRNFYCCIE